MRPKRLTLDGKVIPVEWDAKLGRLSEGWVKGGDYYRGRIRVGKGLTKKQARLTLLHELAHLLWERAGLDEHMSVRNEEMVVDGLLPWVIELLRENPELVEFLTDPDAA